MRPFNWDQASQSLSDKLPQTYTRWICAWGNSITRFFTKCEILFLHSNGILASLGLLTHIILETGIVFNLHLTRFQDKYILYMPCKSKTSSKKYPIDINFKFMFFRYKPCWLMAFGPHRGMGIGNYTGAKIWFGFPKPPVVCISAWKGDIRNFRRPQLSSYQLGP